MRRFIGTVLIGLGALSIVFAVGLPLYVAPAVTKLPYDIVPCPAAGKPQPSGCLKPSVAEATGARFLQIKVDGSKVDVNVNTATLRTTVEVIPQAKLTAAEQKANRLTDSSVVWDVYQTTARTDTSEVVSAYSTEYALDRVSGAAVKWAGTWYDDSKAKDTSINYSGLIYKFPFNTEKKDYQIYDTDVRAASTAAYIDSTDIEGLEVYHFKQTIADTAVKVPDSSMAVLLGRFAPTATTGKVFYRNVREVWVEPTTGAFIKVREQPYQELRPDTGAPVTLLEADFNYTADTVKSSAENASANRLQLKAVSLYGPIGLGVLGALLLGLGFVLVRPRRKEAAGGAPFDAALPDARHSLRDDAYSS